MCPRLKKRLKNWQKELKKQKTSIRIHERLSVEDWQSAWNPTIDCCTALNPSSKNLPHCGPHPQMRASQIIAPLQSALPTDPKRIR